MNQSFSGVPTRREFLEKASNGFGMLALAGLMADKSYAGLKSDDQRPPLVATAEHVIFCFMDGGPSHVDTFDFKPELAKRQNKESEIAPSRSYHRAVPSEFGLAARGVFKNVGTAACGSATCFLGSLSVPMISVLCDRLWANSRCMASRIYCFTPAAKPAKRQVSVLGFRTVWAATIKTYPAMCC